MFICECEVINEVKRRPLQARAATALTRRIQISDGKRSHTQPTPILTAAMPMNWSQYALFYISNPKNSSSPILLAALFVFHSHTKWSVAAGDRAADSSV